MTKWLVTYRERTFLTEIEGEDIETSLIRETIKTDIEDCCGWTEKRIKFFEECHEGADGNYSVKVEVLSWSELEEDYDDEDYEINILRWKRP